MSEGQFMLRIMLELCSSMSPVISIDVAAAGVRSGSGRPGAVLPAMLDACRENDGAALS